MKKTLLLAIVALICSANIFAMETGMETGDAKKVRPAVVAEGRAMVFTWYNDPSTVRVRGRKYGFTPADYEAWINNYSKLMKYKREIGVYDITNEKDEGGPYFDAQRSLQKLSDLQAKYPNVDLSDDIQEYMKKHRLGSR